MELARYQAWPMWFDLAVVGFHELQAKAMPDLVGLTTSTHLGAAHLFGGVVTSLSSHGNCKFLQMKIQFRFYLISGGGVNDVVSYL
jgi:hypothetical protein